MRVLVRVPVFTHELVCKFVCGWVVTVGGEVWVVAHKCVCWCVIQLMQIKTTPLVTWQTKEEQLQRVAGKQKEVFVQADSLMLVDQASGMPPAIQICEGLCFNLVNVSKGSQAGCMIHPMQVPPPPLVHHDPILPRLLLDGWARWSSSLGRTSGCVCRYPSNTAWTAPSSR
jgi:hypothetical protein